MFYDDDADLEHLSGKTVAIIGYGSQGHAHALNLKDSGVDVVVGLRPDSSSVEQARGKGLEVLDIPDAASRGDIVMILAARREARRDLPRADRRRHRARQAAAVRPRLLDPLRRGRAAAGGRRRARRAEGPRPPRAPPVPRGQRRAVPDGGPPGRHRQRARPRARLRQGHRRHARRRDRDDVQGRDRDRPVRRAGRAVRRRQRAGERRLRDARRGRLRPEARVLRVPARAQADRRPHVREGDQRHALLDLQHRRVRRHDARRRGSSASPRARR